MIVRLAGAATSTSVTSQDICTWHDIADPNSYLIRSHAGQAAVNDPVNPDMSVSISKLVQTVLNLQPARVKFIETTTSMSPGAYVATLTTRDLTDPEAAFPNGSPPAVEVVPTSDVIEYIRSVRNSKDVNNPDRQLAPTFYLTVHTTGTLLHPAIAADDTTPAAGTKVTFTATPVGGAYTYHWVFDDGTTADTSDPTVQHSYATKDFYFPSVSVSAADGSSGQSKTLQLNVGKPAPPTPTSSAPGHGGGKHNPTVGPTHGRGPSASSSSPPSSASPTPEVTPTPAGPTSPPAPASAPRSARASTSAAPHSSTPRSAPAPSPASSAPIPSGAHEAVALVKGIVIAGPGAVPDPAAGGASSAHVPDPAAAARADSPQDTLDLTFLWWLLLPSLLVIGGVAELRRPARRRHP
jgi:PKD domain